jgi:hypothetical protein
MRWEVVEPGPINYFARTLNSAGFWQVHRGPRDDWFTASWLPSQRHSADMVFVARRKTARGAQLAAERFAKLMARDFRAFTVEMRK